MGSVTFSKLGQHGQLGNQLFQIAAAVGIALKNDMKPALPAWEYAPYFPNYVETKDHIADYVINEPYFHYSDLKLDPTAAADLLGYFQSEKYWQHCSEQIRYLFNIKNLYKTFPLSLVEIFKDRKNTVAMHVRRGDYVDNPNYFQLTAEYYIKALRRLRKECGELNVLCFSNDIEWCRHNLSEEITGERITYVEGNSAIQDMFLGSQCHHFIIANSSFSWWMARLSELNSEGGSIVLRPEFWNDGDLLQSAEEKDVCPDRWEIVRTNEGYKRPELVDLSDVTFTIPVKFESEDRLQNFFLCLDYLDRNFKTNVIIGEQDKEYIDGIFLEYYSNLKIERLKYIIKDTFERTRMLNDMAHMATTPYIINWDCDVFVKPEQLLKSIQALRDNKADGVYPYDGKFLRVNRQWIPRFKQAFDVGIFKNVKFKEVGHVSFGGAIAWNREKFLEGGGENQYFVHYGPEDYERYERFKKLGYRIGRVEGPLYHINHSVADNGALGHTYLQTNKEEFEKVQKMSADELREYVTYWPWKKQPWGDFYQPEDNSCALGLLQADHTYVINLHRRPDRLQSVIKQFENIGFEKFTLAPAVDGQSQNLKHERPEISPGMVGCFETHRQILNHAVENNLNTIIVLEDDIKFSPGFNSQLKEAWKTLPDDWQFIHLGHYEHGGMQDFASRVNKNWVVPKAVWGTHGYAVRGIETMKELRKAISVMKDQIDVQMFGYMRESNIKRYAVYPALIDQDFERLGTDVQVPQKQKLF